MRIDPGSISFWGTPIFSPEVPKPLYELSGLGRESERHGQKSDWNLRLNPGERNDFRASRRMTVLRHPATCAPPPCCHAIVARTLVAP